MGVKVKWKVNKDLLAQMKKNAKAVSGTSVEVGVLEGDHQWLAGIHEYGVDIKVTDGTVDGEGNMRGWLGAHGLHLNPGTTHIHIPERSFLRAGYDKESPTVLKHAAAILADVAAGNMTPDELYENVGIDLSDRIKDYATNLNDPPNHPFTIAQKGTSNPLEASGDMIGGITWRKG